MLLRRLQVMDALFFFFLHLVFTNVICDEQLRPAAIIPWSQYQRRLGKLKEGSLAYQKEEESPETLPSSNSFFGSYEKEDLSAKHLPRFDESEPSKQPNKARSYGNVIRPQIRGRLPADPSDFVKIPKTNQVEYLAQRELEREVVTSPSRPMVTEKPTRMKSSQLPSRTALRMEQTLPEMTKVASLAIPNGVPMTAASWETGQPHYTGDRKLHAANTFAGSAPFYGNNLNEIATAPIYQKAGDANIVSSIFSQSQARSGAIPTMVQTSQPQAYLEKFLTDGASLDQFSKLAKNLLGVGGGNGESGGGNGGLLETMTSVFSGANRNLPTSSAAHDDLSQYTPSSAGRPQTSVFQKLLNQATDALKDSWKQKETKDKTDLESGIKKPELFSLPIPEKTPAPEVKEVKLSKDRENSIKLLENMPAEQRKMLEAAILSGEIDADSPAIKTLVKNDLTEESKKEKENRLIEWIRANRPSKTTPENALLKNVPYYGKYLGSLAETPTTKKQKSPAGALWLVDERRIMVTRFVFESGSLLNENVTFWLGPKTPTGNFVEDFMPSENGFYVKPKPIEMSAFAMKELPPIEAKRRVNVSAVKLFEGLPPIVANVSRSKREAETTAKPIELYVEGGIMKILPGKETLEMKNESVPDGFRLRQPEFDLVDEGVPQPLQWFEGFQPLMLTLPSTKVFSDIHWVSLRDHKRNTNVASVILPNGPLMKAPNVVRLRALSPNSLAYNISSGPTEVLDVKTIRFNNFSFQHDDDSVWLMVGSELFPNMGGKIVPLFEEKSKSFDCQALRSYHNETLTFRLPGELTWKDVFWFSFFSMKRLVSYSETYLPLSDMHLLPDLSSISTPTCKFTPE